MKTLIVCPTYGRIPYLNRVLASFLSQTYDDKHLVIVNDDKNVDLCCAHKQVTCINLNTKLLLPQKRNVGIMMGYHDLIMQFDDDDIFLPNRISNHVQKHIENPEILYYWNATSYMIYGDKFLISSCSPTHSSVMKKIWFEVGGYANKLNVGEDYEFFYKLPNHLKKEEQNAASADYVYNYGGINYHATFSNDDTIDQIAYDQLVEMNILNKKYWIEPDYEEFNKFITLESIYKQKQEDLIVKHVSQGKIDIDHLLV